MVCPIVFQELSNLFYVSDERGLTALLIAVEVQCVGDAQRLLPLNCNCDIKADNNEQQTGIYGLLANNEEMILLWPRVLMGRIIRAETLLMLAVVCKNNEIIRLLLSNHEIDFMMDIYEEVETECVVGNVDWNGVQAGGCSPNVKDKNRQPALMIAYKSSSLKMD